MAFSYLITTINKTEEQILSIVSKANVKGIVFVGNQNSESYSEKLIIDQNIEIHIFNIPGKGVSKNRNLLLSKANSDFIMFLDDDVSFLNDSQRVMEEMIEHASSKFNAHRFNSLSINNQRPINQIKKNGTVTIMELRNFGVWGIYFNRTFLMKNSLLFDENVGPGSIINHGEDFLFMKNYLKKNKIYQHNYCGFSIEQKDSTWTGQNRDIIRELFSHGFLYKRSFGIFWRQFLFVHFLKHKDLYKDYWKQKYKICEKGAKYYLITKKNKNIDKEHLYNELTRGFYE